MAADRAIDAKEEKRRIWAWQLYDWADSAFATIVLTGCLPLYFSKVCTAGLPQHSASLATSLWGATAAISMALVAVAALLLGPIADATARKKRCLGWFLALGAAATAALAFCPPRLWWMISILFILGNLGFCGGNIFYDSLLPSVAGRDKLDRVSSGGYALGYLGGGLLLAVCLGVMLVLPMQRVEGGGWFPVVGMRLSFLSTAAWWALFSLPLFGRVPEPAMGVEASAMTIRIALGRLAQTARNIRAHSEMVKFLIAFWLYSDGFGTIIKMAVIYAGEIFAKRRQDPTAHLIGTVLLVQFVGIPCTLFWGRVARRFGAKSAVMACLFVYMLICIFGYFMDAIWHFYVLGLAVAFVQGGSQALSRSLFAVLVPQGKEAEFFGFYNISGKFAGVIGPAMMSIIAVATGTSRPAILALIVFFVLGAALLAAVRFDGQANSHERRMS